MGVAEQIDLDHEPRSETAAQKLSKEQAPERDRPVDEAAKQQAGEEQTVDGERVLSVDADAVDFVIEVVARQAWRLEAAHPNAFNPDRLLQQGDGAEKAVTTVG